METKFIPLSDTASKEIAENWDVKRLAARYLEDPQPIRLEHLIAQISRTLIPNLTCSGKGGDYRIIGFSAGAGPRRGELICIYVDTQSGALYHRELRDFAERMEAVTTT